MRAIAAWNKLQASAWLDLIAPDAHSLWDVPRQHAGQLSAKFRRDNCDGRARLGEATGWFGALKYRYVGSRPLTEDGYIQSPVTGTMNARLGYRWADGWRLQLDAFNIFNSRSDQITYGYGSLLPTDALYQPCVNGLAPAAVCGVGVSSRSSRRRCA